MSIDRATLPDRADWCPVPLTVRGTQALVGDESGFYEDDYSPRKMTKFNIGDIRIARASLTVIDGMSFFLSHYLSK